MVRTRPWEVNDAWWEKVKPLIPLAPSHVRGGRPRMDDRQAKARDYLRATHRYPMECVIEGIGSKLNSP
jgi:transposase